jgi:general secretion pathway protein H
VVLGPEPLIGAQRITLSLEDRRVTLATDGIGPFTLTGDDAGER